MIIIWKPIAATAILAEMKFGTDRLRSGIGWVMTDAESTDFPVS